jgi:histidinol-phosphatase (PHP family)
MAILADFHLHSEHSTDSQAPIADMIQAAVNKGLKSICFTEHMDKGFPGCEKYPAPAFEVNVDSYLYDLLTKKKQFEKDIEVYFGLEMGLQESAFRDNAIIAKSHEFDFIIGSIHLVDGKDPYDPDFFKEVTGKPAVTNYFKTTLANIKKFQNFDILGHMDYIARKLPEGEDFFKPSDYSDLLDEILTFLIENEKGIELNTSPLVKGFKNPNPHIDILKRYKELGGDRITVGSDAHKPENVGAKFDVAEEILKSLGYKYYCVYSNRIANYQKLV